MGAHAYVSVPILTADGAAVGTLCGLDRSPRGASPEEVAWLRILASLVGFQIERARFESQLAHQASHDPLTELPNRVGLLEHWAGAERRAERSGNAVALLFLDLDDFKRVNDTLGHAAGDHLLRAVAERLRSCVRADDLVVRHGGDEFIILAEKVEKPQDAIVLAERVLQAFRLPFDVWGESISTAPSIGIALSEQRPDSVELEHLLHAADLAMYEAKRSGKGCYKVYEPGTG
jgi:diguanylate cyclase (GGDEF)-like protein